MNKSAFVVIDGAKEPFGPLGAGEGQADPELSGVMIALRELKHEKLKAVAQYRMVKLYGEQAIQKKQDELEQAVLEAHLADVTLEELIEIDPDLEDVLDTVLEVLL